MPPISPEAIISMMKKGKGRLEAYVNSFQKALESVSSNEQRKSYQNAFEIAEKEYIAKKANAKTKETAFRRRQELAEARKEAVKKARLNEARLNRNRRYNALSRNKKRQQINREYHGLVIIKPNGTKIGMNKNINPNFGLNHFRTTYESASNKQAISKVLKYIVNLRSRFPEDKEDPGHQRARETRAQLSNNLKQNNSVTMPGYKVLLYPRNVEFNGNIIIPSFLPNLTRDNIANLTNRIFSSI